MDAFGIANPAELKHMNPNKIRRTLGKNLNATDDNTEVMKELVVKFRNYTKALYESRLTAKQK